MWGGFGFGVASVIGGYVFDAGTGGYKDVMITFVTLTLVTIVAATLVPIGITAKAYQEPDEPSGEEHDNGGKRQVSTNGREIAEKTINRKHVGSGAAMPMAAAAAATSNTTGPNCRSACPPVGNPPALDAIDETIVTTIGTGGDNDEERGLAQNGADDTAMSAVWRALRTVDAVSFLATVVLSGMGSGFIDTFLFIRLEELGGSHTLFGIARLIMCLAEVPFFYISGPILRRIGPRGVASFAQLGFLCRFLYYSVLRNPWWVLPAEVLHGLTFATMWSATIEYAHEVAPVSSETTMVGIVSGLHQGLGVGLGALIGGFLYAGLGPAQCFVAFAALPCVNILMLALPAVLRCLHIGGGSQRKEVMIDEEGLDGWGVAESRDVVPDQKHPSRNERQGENNDEGPKNDRNVASSGNGLAQLTASDPSAAWVGTE